MNLGKNACSALLDLADTMDARSLFLHVTEARRFESRQVPRR